MNARGWRVWTARLAAPTAFLLAATVAILLIRAGLDEGDRPAAIGSSPATTATLPGATTLPDGTAPATTGSAPARRFYTIRRGDTLAAVAARFGTTVEELRALNPDVDPVALTVGQRIRVR